MAPAEDDEPSQIFERRLVSVLFVDLVDFTSLAEGMDPELVRVVQSRYFEAVRSVVTRYGGTVEKFIGDAAMAVWGAQAAHEDDGERAVRAALEVVAAVAGLGVIVPGQRVLARAAVGTGQVAASPAIDGQGMVAGDLVNTVARLQTAAPPGGVLVDEATRLAASQSIVFEPAGRLSLKGKGQPVAAWFATAAAREGRSGASAGHAGPSIGREGELAELIDIYQRVRTVRHSRIVSVFGIAGIGKSRLAWELQRRLAALPDPPAVHAGRAPAYGEGTTFAPVAEIVRQRADITEGTPTEIAERQLRHALDEAVADEGERGWIAPRLAALISPDPHAVFERDELFTAWRRYLEHVAEATPTLLVFEDLQWADPALLDFIDHLAMWSRASPIMVLALARPELLDSRPMWAAGHRSLTVIHLEPLSDEQMTELVLGLVPRLPRQTVRRIVERAGGVPLYAVEFLRTLVDHGQARAREDGYELIEAPGDVDLPDTLRSLVSARIDALPAADRSVLLAASVLGSRFHPSALAAIARLEQAEMQVRIAALVRGEVLAVDDDPRSPSRGRLSFVQEVVREVAYGTVSLRDRRRLHLAAADHLEALGDDGLTEAIAEHLAGACQGAMGRPDSGLADRAVAALRLAASRALALRAPARALSHLQRAIELTDDEETRSLSWLDAARAAKAVPRFDLAEGFLRQLLAWQESRGLSRDAGRTRAELASLLLATERHDAALDDLENALGAAEDLGSDAATVELGAQLARAHVLVGHDRLAIEWADRTLDAGARLGIPSVAVDALITRGTARARLGDEVDGLDDLRSAVAEAQRAGFLGAELRARNNLAWLVVADDPHATMEAALGGLELATRMGAGDWALQFAEVVCTVAIDTGRWDLARSVLDEVQDRLQAPAHTIEFTLIEGTLGALRGEADAASALAALQPLAQDADPQLRAALDKANAWTALLDGRLETAQALAESAAHASLGAERHAALVLAARAALWRGDEDSLGASIATLAALKMSGRAVAAAESTLRAGAAMLGGSGSAPRMYEDAIASWRRLDLPLNLAICLAERDRLLDRPADEARSILAGLGAEGVLHGLDHILPVRRAVR